MLTFLGAVGAAGLSGLPASPSKRCRGQRPVSQTIRSQSPQASQWPPAYGAWHCAIDCLQSPCLLVLRNQVLEEPMPPQQCCSHAGTVFDADCFVSGPAGRAAGTSGAGSLLLQRYCFCHPRCGSTLRTHLHDGVQCRGVQGCLLRQAGADSLQAICHGPSSSLHVVPLCLAQGRWRQHVPSVRCGHPAALPRWCRTSSLAPGVPGVLLLEAAEWPVGSRRVCTTGPGSMGLPIHAVSSMHCVLLRAATVYEHSAGHSKWMP